MKNAFNLAAYVLQWADRQPDKIALEVIGDAPERLSYADLKAATLSTARGLRDLGLAPGARVLLRLSNSVDFPIAYLGAIAADLVPVPTSSLLTEAEVAQIIAELQPSAILTAPGVPCPKDARCLTLDQLRAMKALAPLDFAMGDPDRPGYIIYTSGTSGRPRAVVHAHRAILARRMMFDGWYGLRQDDRLMHAGAFNWTYTLGTGLMDPWTCGATALIPAQGVKPEALLGLAGQNAATIFAAAPGLYRQALRGDVPALPDLRHGLSAGEKLPDVTRSAWEAATGTAIYEAFGMSEISTFVSGSPARPAPAGSLGHPQKGRRVALLDAVGPVKPGTPGIIAVHRADPGLFLEYLGQPAETAGRFRGDWFLTGDMGVEDEDGSIRYLGRDDDMMNAGGVRVSPLEVERAINAFTGISASAAVELAVKEGTSIIGAFYTSADAVDETALMAYLGETLARYKQPRQLMRVEEIPTGANGKILRRKLRETWKGPA